MHGEPLVFRTVGDAHEDAGICRHARRPVNHTNLTIAELLAGVPEQSHAAFAAQRAVFTNEVFNDELARPDVLPAFEVAAIKQRERGNDRSRRRRLIG